MTVTSHISQSYVPESRIPSNVLLNPEHRLVPLFSSCPAIPGVLDNKDLNDKQLQHKECMTAEDKSS